MRELPQDKSLMKETPLKAVLSSSSFMKSKSYPYYETVPIANTNGKSSKWRELDKHETTEFH